MKEVKFHEEGVTIPQDESITITGLEPNTQYSVSQKKSEKILGDDESQPTFTLTKNR